MQANSGCRFSSLAVGMIAAVGAYCLLAQSSASAQIVSHDLRRLAGSSNQFGMDALRALDKIEPPDKVLVFCPACLSSSLTMIMMGSSKLPVVSSLRHALYVWSLKPHEINKGSRDILEHLGTNNQLSAGARPGVVASEAQFAERRSESLDLHEYNGSSLGASGAQLIDESAEGRRLSSRRSLLRPQSVRSTAGEKPIHAFVQLAAMPPLTLQKLMNLRELSLERSNKQPWWLDYSASGARQRRALDERQNSSRVSHLAHHQLAKRHHQPRLAAESATSFKLANTTSNLAWRHASTVSQMQVISNIYLQRGLSMNYNYHLLLRQFYKTVIHPVDFIRNAEETRQHINSLVAANTEGKIKDLVKRDKFDLRITSPKVMLISTFHFRGTLDIEMKQVDRTQPSQSVHNTNRTINARRKKSLEPKSAASNQKRQFIETEPTLLKYAHSDSLGCSVIEIPFINRLVSLVIVMPDNQNLTDLLLVRMSAQIFSDLINSLVVKKLSLEIPVIKFDRGPINVQGLMRQLELEQIFFGDKAYSSETGMNRWMRPSDLLHESSIDIGTVNPNWEPIEDRLKAGAHIEANVRKVSPAEHLRLDRPFFFFVVDSMNGLILTMGRIRS